MLPINTQDLLLRIALIVILLMHAIPGIFDGGIYAFGKQYLDEQGFAPFGLALAWIIKLSHLVCAISLAIYRFLWIPIIVNIIILIAGIVMIHAAEGWYVVGGGRNGAEFNVLLIAGFVQVLINFKNSKTI